MVLFTYLTLAASAVLGAVAAPAAEPSLDLPDFDFAPRNLTRRQDYSQNYKTSGNVQFSPTSNGYSVSFSGAGDFVVGKGWRTGTSRTISYSGSSSRSSGTVLLSVYGWTRNPLIEYYVQEWTSDGKGSAQGQKVGTYQADGATWDLWKHQQVNQPSIAGTTTFWQYIANRQGNSGAGSGSVNMGAHFAAWQKFGLNLGQHDYQVLATEGWGGAGGRAQYTIRG
ncbi:glycoside hydrolase family 11 protein [Parathielavia appendiculata]|uniref:Endo-1,4-beta-xylanase n=1 Tax=Parathielavia appendiculata TaxID=2587402 RepID=A0AAN6TZT6_9PEZI|nr:glycoside hydrolase family 11 protein [Parathielavia appendiculata]